MLTDSHCHLDAEEFDSDRQQVIERARRTGVLRQVIPAVYAEEWPKLREVCAQESGLFAAYGLHPMFLPNHQPSHLTELRAWIEREHPVAIGECGLDFYVEGLDPSIQQMYFQGQLELADEFDLPLIIHARKAVEAVIQAIRKFKRLRGVVHSFSGSEEQARQLWDLGFMISLGGPVTYTRAQRLRRLAAAMPLDYLLIETDSPDQPDAEHRGQRNEPARLIQVCQTIAALRGQDVEEVAKATSANADRLFGLTAQS